MFPGWNEVVLNTIISIQILKELFETYGSGNVSTRRLANSSLKSNKNGLYCGNTMSGGSVQIGKYEKLVPH
jgi:hypothetical protein